MSKEKTPYCVTKVTIEKAYDDGEVHCASVSSSKIYIDDFKEQLMQACLATGWSENQVNSIFNLNSD